MTGEFDRTNIEKLVSNFNSDPTNKLIQNIASVNDVSKLVLNRELSQFSQHVFSHQVEPKTSVTNQRASGRCWMFAGLNVARRAMIQKYDLPKDFELSQSYLFFWDKFERINHNIELIIETWKLPIDSREVQKILSEPCEDGGQWDMFVSLINKYGIVPKSVFGESFHSSHSRMTKYILSRKFHDVSFKIRNMLESGGTVDEAREEKNKLLEWTFNTLCKLFGTPPTEDKVFTWEYYTKKDKYTRIDNLTPMKFMHNHVPLDFNDFICVIHDPRKEHPYYHQYTVKYLGNVIGGAPIRYINVPIEQLKRITYQCLTNNQAVWFGCDFGKYRSDCDMDIDLVQIDELFNLDLKLTKEERLRTGDSVMTHAMTFTGCNIINSETGEIDRWQVENSHGKKEPADGYCVVTDRWFSEYVYEVVVPKQYLTVEMVEALKDDQVIELPPWDPMGALANTFARAPIGL